MQEHHDIKGLHKLPYERKVQIVHNILKIVKNIRNRDKNLVNLKKDCVNILPKKSKKE
jgi:hypothetical protein